MTGDATRDRPLRLGLLGGTFDPPHVGHLWLAETAREQLQLDRVLFLPAGRPPHKEGQRITEVSRRLEMLRLATADNPHFVIDTTDAERQPPHTTHSLLPLIQDRFPRARLWLLLGADSLRDLPTWRNPHRIATQCRMAVLPRPDVEIEWQTLNDAIPGLQDAVDMLNGFTFQVSSTGIRQRARYGRSLRYLMPASVIEYIAQNDLYPSPVAADSA